ncbi:MAG: PA2169 family four-helix-bundle protein [Tepidisphaeraceae bacterium]
MYAQGGSRDVINKVIRYYFDAKEDYRLAAKRAPTGEIRQELERLVIDREKFHMQLQHEITRHGVEMSDNGTAAADLKRDWERLRGSIAGHGFDAALKLGDQSDAHALEQIGLLATRDLPAELRAILDRHADELRQTRSRVHEMKSHT